MEVSVTLNRHRRTLPLLFGVFVGLSATAVLASVRLAPTIPFDFIVADAVLQAGKYTFEIPANRADAIVIRSSDRRVTQRVQQESLRAGGRTPEHKMVFTRYGEQRFLSQIWIAGDKFMRQIARCSMEEKLIASGQEGTPVAIVMR
jgi:hypothetical protein